MIWILLYEWLISGFNPSDMTYFAPKILLPWTLNVPSHRTVFLLLMPHTTPRLLLKKWDCGLWRMRVCISYGCKDPIDLSCYFTESFAPKRRWLLTERQLHKFEQQANTHTALVTSLHTFVLFFPSPCALPDTYNKHACCSDLFWK